MVSNTIRLEGTVEDVVFQNTTTGYVVLELSTESDLVTVVGELGEVKQGESLILDGEYSTHSKFGVQFKACYCERKLPDTIEGIEKYLSSGIIEGIGSATAKRIVDSFGEDTFYIIENHPERLAEIKGISRKKAERISNELRHIFNLKAIVDYLMKFGIGSSVAMKAFRRWKYQTLEKIKDNPYILCLDGINLEFEVAESIATECGIGHESFKRLCAGFDYVLMSANLNGHSCLPLETFIMLSRKTLLVKDEILTEALSKSIDEGRLYVYTDSHDDSYVYSVQYYKAETYIARKVYSIVQSGKSIATDYSKVIQALEQRYNITYGNRQKEAINLSLNCNFMMLTGGPGTGKTTTLKAIINAFKERGLKVKVTAPTGRASQRISEITGEDAMTIHRLLEVTFDNDGNQKFFHDEGNPLNCHVLVVDETSMVDTLLFESLLRAIHTFCKVVLVGDSNQLPSVGAGNILKDLIDSGVVPLVTLDEIFRQAQESAIVMNAHKILNGEYPNVKQKDSDFFFLQRLNVLDAKETIIDLWKHRLPKAYGYDSINDIQVLSPSRKGALGTVNLNKWMQEAINPHLDGKFEIKSSTYTFREFDKVMQIRNNYDIVWHKDGYSGSGIYNGDIGIIEDISSDSLSINFDGRRVVYDRELVDQLELAYAITIHKSQGSEFDVVIMPMLSNYRSLSYRNLLYTGITRAKKLLVIVGSTNALFQMVDNDQKILRYTCLKDMMLCEFNDDN